jgi:dTDP-glucose 4,6-dehydratase
VLDDMSPSTAKAAGGAHERLIQFVKDRPGHDRRYAIDATKIHQALGWKPAETFETGIRKTVAWYLEHAQWVKDVRSGDYRDWMTRQYGAAGLAAAESTETNQAANGTRLSRAAATGVAQ